MGSDDYRQLIAVFGAKIGLSGLEPEADDTLSLQCDDCRLHVSRTEDGLLSIWSLIDAAADDVTLRRAMELNFLFASRGDGTIVLNRDTKALILYRTEEAGGKDGAWLETRVAAFLAVHRLARAISIPKPEPDVAGLDLNLASDREPFGFLRP